MKKYADYKESGVEWLGYIPRGFNIILLKHIVKTKITDGPHETPISVEEGIPFISAEAIQNFIINFDSKWGYISIEDHKKYSKKCKPKNGDIFIVKSGATTGKVAYVNTNIEFNIWSPLALVRANENIINSRYLFYFIISPIFQEQIQFSWSFGTQQNIGMGVIQNLKIVIPPLSIEQESIVRFLDYKTGQIDKFISNRQKQIELLKEQKISIINYAITRGIDKDIKLKKSETLTLDSYPEHWSLTKVKYLLKKKRAAIRTGPFGTQLKNSDLREDGKIKIYNQRSVIDKNFIAGNEYISLEKYEDLKDFLVNPNDFLITTRGTIGKCAVFPNGMEIGVLHPCLIRMQLDERIILNEYAMVCFENALYFQEEIKLLSNSTVIEVIYSYNLKEVFLPIPPLKEQQSILNFIKEETTTIDTLVSKYEKQISLMQEYRTALISQAVTGKIDVRDWQPKPVVR